MPSLTANQIVAYNLARIRKVRGLSQGQAAELLEPYLGARWSKAVYSAAERSYDGKRVRQFTADNLVAISKAFGVPVVYFFLPPKAEDRGPATSLGSGEHDIAWSELFDVMLGGAYRSTLLPRVLELPAEDRPAASTRLGQLIALVSSNGSAAAERDRMATEMRDRSIRRDLANRPIPEEEGMARPIATAIVTSERGVLVGQRRDGRPPWTFISGEVEPGESPAFAASREVKEEATLDVEVGDLIGERDHPKTGRHMYYLAATPTHGTEIFVGDDDELAEVRWVSLAEADELMKDYGIFDKVREHLARELGES